MQRPSCIRQGARLAHIEHQPAPPGELVQHVLGQVAALVQRAAAVHRRDDEVRDLRAFKLGFIHKTLRPSTPQCVMQCYQC